MRILLISHFFPPYNSVGAVRVGKTARYLAEAGNDVRVLTTSDQPLQTTLPLELPREHVVYTPWLNVNRPVELLLGGRGRVAARGYTVSGARSSLLKRLGRLYKLATNLPDGQIGWYPYAVAAGRRLLRDWRADVVFASALPVTSLLVAHRLARGAGIPWVAEFRDLWLDNPYLELPPWRVRLERVLERRVMSSPSGLVTVSEPLAETLRERFGLPVRVITNGFDPEDYPEGVSPPQDGVLRILYTGTIYEGRRDPSPLFAALAQLGDLAGRVRVVFHGRYLDVVRGLAARFGVEQSVEVNEPLAHHAALGAQAAADVLLLLLWNDPRERGSFTGKLFEYLGARRPILCIGPEDNVAARLVTERGAGHVATYPGRLATLLRSWVEAKRSRGTIGSVPPGASAGFSRREQTAKLLEFMEECLRFQAP